MKKILILLMFSATMLFSQGRVATHPVWHGFQKILTDTELSTVETSTNVFKASEILGVGTLWIEATSAYTGTVTCVIYLYNEKTNSWATAGTVTFTNLAEFGNVVEFSDEWMAADEAMIGITLSTGTATVDVYVGTE